LRIISGSHKGRKILAPKHLPVRPTTDLAREGLFNVLSHLWDFEGIEVLDLFAGTGAISYEFASRGAGSITAVDSNYACIKFISETSRKLNFQQIKTIRGDVFRHLAKTSQTYDIIFADPPYDLRELVTLPEIILTKGLLRKDGNLIVEHPAQVDFSMHPGFEKLRKYSRVNFSFFTSN
jgi:16S rRNA (guanine(966)-N(2))-methyltransferase RsmD